MTARNTTPTELTRAPARKGHGGPAMLIFLGLLLLLFAVLVITLQTQTNEAYINGTQQSQEVIQAQWDIWLQIPKLFLGDKIPGPMIQPSDLIGIIIGQGVELVYLALITEREVAAHTSKKQGQIVGTIVLVFLILISIFNFYTDLVYGNASAGAHVAFAIFCTFVAGFFPAWGIALIEHGWKRV